MIRNEEISAIASFHLDIPKTWRELPIDDLKRVVMVIGKPDVGKTTLSSYLYRTLIDAGKSIALLDGDTGQSSLGPPTMMTLFVKSASPGQDHNSQIIKRYFVGSISPTRHMLSVLVGAAKLVEFGFKSGAGVIVYDTSGLIDPISGGLALKNAKIDLLRPEVLIAIQREQELQSLIVPHRRSGRGKIIETKPSNFAYSRSIDFRRLNRQMKFADYFRASHETTLDWSKLAIFPSPVFRMQRLVSLEDGEGFSLGLGIVTRINRERKLVSVLTPTDCNEQINSLRLGDLLVDPINYYHEQIS
jgi:polynucleotide 5'-hydroxyl-kinase GRC3/NOL9